MALNSIYSGDMLLRNYSVLTHSRMANDDVTAENCAWFQTLSCL